jgi:carboxyl-terminal processing protease
MKKIDVFLLMILSFYIGMNIHSFSLDSSLENSFYNEEKIQEVFDIMESSYVDPTVFEENENFHYGMISGLVSGLDDPYSVFMTPEDNKEFFESLEGNFEGIGAELSSKEGVIQIVTPLKNSPAEKAGILTGDIILQVDGEDISGEHIFAVVQRIRGEKGTEVVLDIFRPSEGKMIKKTIVRETIHIDSVDIAFIEENEAKIAHISVNQFGESTTEEFKKALTEAKKENISGIIVDLRNNGGGVLDSAIQLSSFFLEPKTPVVRVKTKYLEKEEVSTFIEPRDTETPVVVLINKGSASASEILAGALKDNNRATIIGETSFGKGTVQQIIPFRDGTSLRLTIAHWLTPNGTLIDKEGIAPHIEQEKTQEGAEEGEDLQVKKAVEVLLKK